MNDTWHADTYCQFLEARTRPARDLLAAIPDNLQPAMIYDLGCGPGNSTALLAQRWPSVKLIGIDSSVDMISHARRQHPKLHFIQSDMTHFTYEQPANLLFANASLQWLDDHEHLIPRLVQNLAAEGMIAIQIPNNFHHPSHQTTVELLQDNKDWHVYLSQLRYSRLTQPFYNATWYYDLLCACQLSNIQLWQTNYLQVMEDHDAIYTWMSGTGLRPVLNVMNEQEQVLLKQAYLQKIKKAYPTQTDGTILLPYQRLFMIGTKKNT